MRIRLGNLIARYWDIGTFVSVLCADIWYGREDLRKTGACVGIDGVKQKKREDCETR